MTLLESYRKNAEVQRDAARATDLPNKRALHERSALMWENMAIEAEKVAAMARTNAEEKARVRG
jgi:hypothetical protein